MKPYLYCKCKKDTRQFFLSSDHGDTATAAFDAILAY
jgi:hypothetical protein